MSESADAENCDALTGAEFGIAQSAIDGDARAEKRRGFNGGEFIGNARRVAGLREDILRVAPIHADAGNHPRAANIFAAGAAGDAFAAAPIDPGHTDALAEQFAIDAGAEFHDATDHFVAENQRQLYE